MPHPFLKEETGTIIKEWRGKVSIALVYPNTYGVGMANLGLHVMYGAFNSHPHAVCERMFLPAGDREAPLSLESSGQLKDFDLIAFSVSDENDYVSALRIIRAAGIPLRSAARGREHPPIIAGGITVTLNPVPLAPFFDALFIGEGEEASQEIVDVLRKTRSRGKDTFLESLRDIRGFFVPSQGAGEKISRRWTKNIDTWPARTIISSPRAGLGGMHLVEISRGCRWKCRFCAASFAYLPPRERSLSSLRPVLTDTGASKTGLVSAMVSDHSEIENIFHALESRGRRVSVSSLRASSSSQWIIEALAGHGHKTLTIAPETGSERLRKAINKPLSDRDILDAVRIASDAGIPALKLYFLVGLPTEAPEDLDAICDLVGKIREIFAPGRSPSPLGGEGRVRGKITVALSPFVPKAWTPFQWAPYDGTGLLKEKIGKVRRILTRLNGITIKEGGLAAGAVEAFLSRGDESTASAVEKAVTTGWREILPPSDHEVWKEKNQQERFPWDMIETGCSKTFLLKEYHRAPAGKVTPACDVIRCKACGIC